jgi:type IV pilus assembly protein PilQ
VTTVTLVGTGPLPRAQVVADPGDASGIYLDLPNVTWTLPQVTPVDRDPVRLVRSSLVPGAPLTTRVALELSRDAEYRLDRSPAGDALTITFDEAPPDPLTLLTERAPVPQQGVSPATPGLAQQGGPQPGPAAPAPQFTGEPISLDFQDADLRAVLRVFADVSGLNVVIDPTVQGTVDVALRDVPWDQALDIILRANRLGYSVEGTIVRIAPLTALAQEEAERAALAEQQALAGELGVETVTLSYARAADLAPLLEQTVLSARGSIRTDVRTNTLIISDLAQQLNDARALISTLDVSQAQVEIEARIIQTSRDFAQALGVQWGASGQATAALGNTLPTTFPNELAGTARDGPSSTKSISWKQ